MGKKPLLYACLGRGLTQTRPTLFCSWPLDQDPDGSGSIQRSWSVSLIRIHQIRGFGLFTRRPLVFFQFLELFLLCTPTLLLPELLCVLKFLPKIRKNYYVFLDAFLAVLWYFLTLKWIKICMLIIPLNLNIFVYFGEISCMIFVPIQCHIISVLVI